MIEVISESRCTGCNICVRICPTNVFEAVTDSAPIIARQEDCQTCFMCELYCPSDALFVAPDADAVVHASEPTVTANGQLGQYRSAIGWGVGRSSGARADQSFRLLYQASTPGSVRSMGAALPGAEPVDEAAPRGPNS